MGTPFPSGNYACQRLIVVWMKTKFLDVKYGTHLKIFGETTSRWTPGTVTMETAMLCAMSWVALWWSWQLMAENHPILQTKRWWATWKHNETTLLSNSDKSPLQTDIICPISVLSKAMNYSKSKKKKNKHSSNMLLGRVYFKEPEKYLPDVSETSTP